MLKNTTFLTRLDIIMYEIGDIVRTKKFHPCGSNEWKITRIRIRL